MKTSASMQTIYLVVDPFAGGGAISMETLRVGAQSFASDINPIAVLIDLVDNGRGCPLSRAPG
jgi:adenine-specific DNA methylase